MTSSIRLEDVASRGLRRDIRRNLSSQLVVGGLSKVGSSTFRARELQHEGPVRLVEFSANSLGEAVVAEVARADSVQGFPELLGTAAGGKWPESRYVVFRWNAGEGLTGLPPESVPWTTFSTRQLELSLAAIGARFKSHSRKTSDAESRLAHEFRLVLEDYTDPAREDFYWGAASRRSIEGRLPAISRIVRGVSGLSTGIALSHGDLHPGNVVATSASGHVIDGAYRWTVAGYDRVSWLVAACELGHVSPAEASGRVKNSRALSAPAVAALRICARLSRVLTGPERDAPKAGITEAGATALSELLDEVVFT